MKSLPRSIRVCRTSVCLAFMYVALLTQLLDILVKNCGYPVHLQLGTKEFLNELVRRFPERPPMHPSPVMSKILEMIHEWRQTLCVTSKHKEDLVHIRDMHRLLMYKGYRFPKVDARNAAVLNTEHSLQSPEELEEENRLAQGAKLQELIRRGTPRDLQQAQELMKVMSGAEPESSVQTAQVVKELEKVQARIKLLNDMLDQAKPTEKFVSGDAYDQVASNLRSVQPRLQKWVSQAEEEESEQLAKFLEVNDLINQTLARYDAMVQGDTAKANASKAKVDLISFDEEEEAAPAQPKSSGFALDDLASLSIGPSTPASGQSTPQPASQPQPTSQPPATSKAAGKQTALDLLGDWDDTPSQPISLGMSSTPATSSTRAAQPTPAQPTPPASNDPFAGLDLLK